METPTKTQTLEDRLTIIRETIKAGSARLMEASGSFRVDFPSGHAVYIYPETYDNRISARYETKTADAEARRREAAQALDALAREFGFADVSVLQEDASPKGRFAYTARLHIDPSLFFHETIMIGGTAAPGRADQKNAAREPATGAPALTPGNMDERALAEEAVSRLETIDAKMLRLSLDMMNLKRSSAVRIALTRIFRDAVDADELLRSIENEAVKLTSPGDAEELQMVNEINNDEALEPVIRLLYGKALKAASPS